MPLVKSPETIPIKQVYGPLTPLGNKVLIHYNGILLTHSKTKYVKTWTQLKDVPIYSLISKIALACPMMLFKLDAARTTKFCAKGADQQEERPVLSITLKVLIPAQGVQKRKAGIQRFKASLGVKANTVLIIKQQQNKIRLV